MQFHLMITMVLFEEILNNFLFTGEYSLALPKLNLQFLSFYDYLLRNYDLFRLESAYEIKQDIEKAISHVNPRKSNQNEIIWQGWSRYAIPGNNSLIYQKIDNCDF